VCEASRRRQKGEESERSNGSKEKKTERSGTEKERGVVRGRQGRRKGHSEKAGKSASLSTD